MTPTRWDWRGGRWRCMAASAALSWILSACHSAPVAERAPAGRSPDTAAETPPPSPPESAPPAAETEPSNAIPTPEVPSDGQIALPPCLPEVKPKPKPRPKPKPVQPAPAAPPSGAPVATAPAVVDAVVKPLDAPVVSILGKKVQGLNGDDLGRVVDVLADNSGRVRVAIIEFGGFLGVGNRRIPVDWSLLRVDPNDADKPLTLITSEQKLQSAPEYKDATHPKTLMAPQVPAAPSTPPAPPADDKK
jgi:PRC-barrel domain